MKIVKIIIGFFCFALTLNAFKNGLEPNEGFAFYIPIIIVFVIGVLLFNSAFKSNVKTNVTLISKNIDDSANIETIEEKLKILKEAYDDGMINKVEFKDKNDKLLRSKVSILSKNELAAEYKMKLEKLTNLFKNDILYKEEYDRKISELKERYEFDQFEYENINANSKLYYISKGNEYGPVTIGRIAYLIENNVISQNCFIRLENENSYNKRANEIIKCQENS